MYEVLVAHLRECSKCYKAINSGENTFEEAANAIESLSETNERLCKELTVLVALRDMLKKSPAGTEPEMDWDKAVSNVEDVIQACKELGLPGMLYLGELNSLIRRYGDGVRTRELYEEMMEVH